MGLARTFSAVVMGVRAHIVEVEADLSQGLPGLSIVGLPDTALNEARDRVRAAVVNSGLKWPNVKITVSLSPAWLPKRGSGLDLAIALAILAADAQLPVQEVGKLLSLGELGLDGRVRPRPVHWRLPCVAALEQSGAIGDCSGFIGLCVSAGSSWTRCCRGAKPACTGRPPPRGAGIRCG